MTNMPNLNASLIERAAELYGFEAELFAPRAAPQPSVEEPRPNSLDDATGSNARVTPSAHSERSRGTSASEAEDLEGLDFARRTNILPECSSSTSPDMSDHFGPDVLELAQPAANEPWLEPAEIAPAPVVYRRAAPGEQVSIDRDALAEAGFIVPGGAATGLAEEYRIIKRPLLAAIESGALPAEKARAILVTSAASGDGKSFSALNLALSLAGEEGVEVLLIDGDVVKPGLPSLLGIDTGAGLVDALSDPAIDPENLVIQTDIDGLSLLPAGCKSHGVTELLASSRARDLLAALATADPRRILVIDSPPVLMASPAAALAAHVGQTVMVVRADATSEADLKEAVGLMSACDRLSLLLNAADSAATGRRYGSYYGLDQR